MRISPRTTVNLYALGFVIAGVGQSVMNRRVGKNSRWGESGWQREVVIWNAGTVASIAALRATKGEPDRALATGFTALSAMFAANHIDWAPLGGPAVMRVLVGLWSTAA